MGHFRFKILQLLFCSLTTATLLLNVVPLHARANTEEGGCPATRLFSVGDVSAFGLNAYDSQDAFFFVSGFAVDADGSPFAYHPRDFGLDALHNAGADGHWWALVTDQSGNPVIQGDSDPAPGYYVSMTALEDRTISNARNPRHFVDATAIPYISLPPVALKYSRLGDLAVVINLENGRMADAIIADVGPGDRIGEGSIALAESLGIDPNPRYIGAAGNIMYVVFPDSGDGTPLRIEDIHAIAQSEFELWGGEQRAMQCSDLTEFRGNAALQ
jgi:hypothetical protein